MKTKLNFKEDKISYDMNYHNNKFGNMIVNPLIWKLRGEYAKKEYFSYDFNDKNKVFEFGCGVGNNLACINNKYAYEINKELYPFLKEHGIKMFDELNDIPNKFFDDILICMVLEHIPDPIEKVKLLRTKLKKGGRIRIVLPRIDYRRTEKSIDGHLFGWSFYELNYLLEYCGFKVVYNSKCYRRGQERFAPISKINNNLYHLTVNFTGRILPYCWDFIVIGEKI